MQYEIGRIKYIKECEPIEKSSKIPNITKYTNGITERYFIKVSSELRAAMILIGKTDVITDIMKTNTIVNSKNVLFLYTNPPKEFWAIYKIYPIKIKSVSKFIAVIIRLLFI